MDSKLRHIKNLEGRNNIRKNWIRNERRWYLNYQRRLFLAWRLLPFVKGRYREKLEMYEGLRLRDAI